MTLTLYAWPIKPEKKVMLLQSSTKLSYTSSGQPMTNTEIDGSKAPRKDFETNFIELFP